MSRFRCLVNFYGGKSKISHLYPGPEHDLIIEPFAGMAAYSLIYADHEVILSDLDNRVIAIWESMKLPLNEILSYIPDYATAGDRVSSFLTPETPFGVEQMMRACANRGAFGDKGKYNVITSMAAKSWETGTIKRRIAFWHPQVQHWQIKHGSYENLENLEATWFVDPPYSGGKTTGSTTKGADYLHSYVDYQKLSKWCLSRKGTVIVAEQQGASWLPFEQLSIMNSTSWYGPKLTSEVVCVIRNGKIHPFG